MPPNNMNTIPNVFSKAYLCVQRWNLNIVYKYIWEIVILYRLSSTLIIHWNKIFNRSNAKHVIHRECYNKVAIIFNIMLWNVVKQSQQNLCLVLKFGRFIPSIFLCHRVQTYGRQWCWSAASCTILSCCSRLY